MALSKQSVTVGRDVCDLCCHETSFWAFGACDHPVCLTCCVRMRVLCDKRECSVCRIKLEQVTLSNRIRSYKDNSKDLKLYSIRKYGLIFENLSVKEAYRRLLVHKCPKCPDTMFSSMKLLQDHQRKAHNLFYCEICVENLKLFPFEFKTYSKSELVRHRREGDSDCKSYKGHPICRFCDERYLDNDALMAHLRRNHFWCHICESAGKQDYYCDYSTLRDHFKKEHFLCEIADCKDEQFTSVFRSEIDLKAHKASRHSKELSKSVSKQLRQIDVDFMFTTVQDRRGRKGRANTMRETEEVEPVVTTTGKEKVTMIARPKAVTEGAERKEKPAAEPSSVEVKSLKKPPGFSEVTVTTNNTEWPQLASGASNDAPPLVPPPLPPPGFLRAAKQGTRTLLPTQLAASAAQALPNLASKEREVIKKVRKLLDYSTDSFSTFKALSGWYRNDEITVYEYNKHCSELFGDAWQQIGPELAMVLPVESKQKELMSMFKRRTSNMRKAASKPVNAWGAGVNSSYRKFLSDEEFPSLSATVQ